MDTNIKDMIEEYHAALMENAALTVQENVLTSKRSAARLRLNIAKDNLRALESDIQYLNEMKVINAQANTTV